ncbi:hypothetical protein [Ponticoccus alexandrii]|uniref:Uncharacterized protein n=1 Tax=Ponticoccus alexandrii TaxID=1943633 RepID=A0ABX7FIG7_9RHOB|nr:hypothetical protein [Ponticoccus alexandrii]QRF69147.1 hypothetical protein GQA70_22640 [Ponticoccus alexandrii]
MTDPIPTGAITPLHHTPPELSYPGLSPQLLARTKQLWSARGLDFDPAWRGGIRALPGFCAVPRVANVTDSAAVDLVFLYDQALLWVRALHAATAAAYSRSIEGMSVAQWHCLAGVTARLTEQMTALRLLSLTGLPMPAMQIARSLSEDVDTALVLLIRPKLAQRFADCRTAEDANAFWRRHIAGGRAFKAISEKLYSVGIDHSADTDYAKWRRSVLTILSTAVHSNLVNPLTGSTDRDTALVNDDSLYFATFRVHEFCAYAQLVTPGLTDLLDSAGKAAPDSFAQLAAPLSAILINQIPSLTAPSHEPKRQRRTSAN